MNYHPRGSGTTICPKCKKVGFVRFETVLARGSVHREYYCGACDYAWRLAEDGGVLDPNSVRADRPERSRSGR